MRDEMLGAVVRRAMEHKEFRDQLVSDPKAALEAHGFALEADDFKEIETLGRELGSNSADVEQQLVSIAERIGVHPTKK